MNLDVRSNLVFSIRLEVAEVAGKLCQLEMLGFYVEVQVIVALQMKPIKFMFEFHATHSPSEPFRSPGRLASLWGLFPSACVVPSCA